MSRKGGEQVRFDYDSERQRRPDQGSTPCVLAGGDGERRLSLALLSRGAALCTEFGSRSESRSRSSGPHATWLFGLGHKADEI